MQENEGTVMLVAAVITVCSCWKYNLTKRGLTAGKTTSSVFSQLSISLEKMKFHCMNLAYAHCAKAHKSKC